MKKFFLNVLSSFTGAWIALVLFGIVAVIVVLALVGKMAIAGAESLTPQVKKGTVLVLDLNGTIEETETPTSIDMTMLLKGTVEKPQTLRAILAGLEQGAGDDRVKALYIKCGMLTVSPASAHQLQQAVAKFKESGKPVIAYGDMLVQSAYYISSSADSVFLNPQGALMLSGCGSAQLYMAELFKKIGVDWQIVKVGTYKSAVEPFLQNEMSEPARRQLLELYDVIWQTMRESIAKGRKVEPSLLDSVVRTVSVTRSAAQIKALGLVSDTRYERQIDPLFASITGKDKPEDVNFVSASDLGKLTATEGMHGKHVAVLYASGDIAENSASGIDCYKLVPVITDLAEDDDVKALVLRVNSPGGSVFGSEQIRDALAYFKSKGKPFIVSMGDYAASGGYWISCGADYIFADPLTITGSIGIFGMIPNIGPLLEKAGISTQTVYTERQGLIATPFVPLTPEQMAAMQVSVNRGYDDFLNLVSTNRRIPKQEVDSIAQGRVWIGVQAKKLRLVDRMGNLADAIEYAGGKARLGKEPKVGYYPSVEPSFWDMIPSASASSLGKAVERALDSNATPVLVQYMSDIIARRPSQALMPVYYRVRI